MKITQMKFQKIIVKAAVILAAIALFYAVAIFATPFYQHNDVKSYADYGVFIDITGYNMFSEIQPFNRTLFTICIIYMLVTITLLVFYSQSRRKYFLSNYITIIANAVIGIAVSVYALINIFAFRTEYAGIDFDSINNNEFWIEDKMPIISSSTWSFDIGIIVFVLIILVALALIFNIFWKKKIIDAETAKYAEVDKKIREGWAKHDEELVKEAQRYES